MKATIQTKAFLAALDSVSVGAGTGRTLPILSCVLVEFSEGKVSLTCDNLEARITVLVEGVECEKPFAFCVGVNLLRYALRTETAELSLAKQRLTVKSGGDTLLNTLKTDEFPAASGWKKVARQQVDATTFLGAIKAALASASTDAGRQAIMGVRYDKAGSCMIGTNGARLCIAPAELPVEDSFTLPSANAKLVLSCFAPDDDIWAGASDTVLCVTSKNLTLWVKLSGVPYPNYSQVIPESKPFSTVKREGLIDALKSLSAFTDHGSKVKITPNGAWSIQARQDDGTESNVTLEASQIDKVEPFGVDSRNVLAVLQNWSCDEVAATMNGNCLLLHPEVKTGQLGVTTLLRV